jgi:hypothetical protein
MASSTLILHPSSLIPHPSSHSLVVHDENAPGGHNRGLNRAVGRRGCVGGRRHGRPSGCVRNGGRTVGGWERSSLDNGLRRRLCRCLGEWPIPGASLSWQGDFGLGAARHNSIAGRGTSTSRGVLDRRSRQGEVGIGLCCHLRARLTVVELGEAGRQLIRLDAGDG